MRLEMWINVDWAGFILLPLASLSKGPGEMDKGMRNLGSGEMDQRMENLGLGEMKGEI